MLYRQIRQHFSNNKYVTKSSFTKAEKRKLIAYNIEHFSTGHFKLSFLDILRLTFVVLIVKGRGVISSTTSTRLVRTTFITKIDYPLLKERRFFVLQISKIHLM